MLHLLQVQRIHGHTFLRRIKKNIFFLYLMKKKNTISKIHDQFHPDFDVAESFIQVVSIDERKFFIYDPYLCTYLRKHSVVEQMHPMYMHAFTSGIKYIYRGVSGKLQAAHARQMLHARRRLTRRNGRWNNRQFGSINLSNKFVPQAISSLFHSSRAIHPRCTLFPLPRRVIDAESKCRRT